MLESRFDTISHAIIIKPILIIKTEEKKPHLQSKVCGLCGNFDSNEMNDLQISGSAGESVFSLFLS